jgi:hypothetical protein
MRPFTGFPNEQKLRICRRDAGATAVAAPEIDLEPGKRRSEVMESKEPRQINEFKVMDEPRAAIHPRRR